jgi:hypothetical protein
LDGEKLAVIEALADYNKKDMEKEKIAFNIYDF